MVKSCRQLMVVTALLLLAVSVGSRVAQAGEVNVADDTGFGTSVATRTLTDTTVGDLTGTLTETVFLSGTTYTYEFSLATTTAGADTFTTAKGGQWDSFDPTLNYGQIGTPLNLPSTAPCGNGTNTTTGFCFNSAALKVFVANALNAGQTFDFYAQSSLGPVPGSYTAQDGVFFTDSNVLDPGPEPSSVFLFGTGLLGLAGLLRRRLSA